MDMAIRFIILSSTFGVAVCFFAFQPEQIHLSYGDNLSEMVVTWSTHNKTSQPMVEYSFLSVKSRELKLKAIGYTKQFVSIGFNKFKGKTKTQYIHTAKLSDLKPDSSYMYHVGSTLGWSELFVFKTPPANQSNWSPHIVIYGDMGNENPQSLPRLQQEVQQNMYDAIVHVGDFAYDLDSEVGERGDEFMRQIQSIATYVPYMTTMGNHEGRNNYSEYRNRFNMPGGSVGSFFYSFDMGPVHFISISTEVYYYTSYGLKLIVNQYSWLEENLKEATKPENRKQRPWIVIFGHRPMYCSNKRTRDCSEVNARSRVGLPIGGWFGLEDLFHQYKVDLAFWGHQHSYERLWPIYNYTVLNGSTEAPYTNPQGIVHITSGSAGCKEMVSPFEREKPYWSAFRSTDYGYTRLKAENHTHLHISQVSDTHDGAIIDDIWIIKNKSDPHFS